MWRIEYFSYAGKTSKDAILQDCDEFAINNGGQPVDLLFSKTRHTFESKAKAEEYIDWLDQDNISQSVAVRYKDGDDEKWLVKVAFHC